ncbi:MAG: CpsD/CapB family tyrosine-protein kinase [Lachnospiraceae bacterium]
MSIRNRQQSGQDAVIEKDISDKLEISIKPNEKINVEHIDINDLKVDKKPRPLHKIVMDDLPELPYAVEEAINRLRVNISFLGSDIKTIMVTSTMPNEGKSFVSLHLWRQLAQAGIPTLFVDIDLRKSVLVEKYSMHREDDQTMHGTSYYLANKIPLSEVVFQSEIPNGYILPNVDNVINPSMLLESNRFKMMFEQMKAAFRYVIIDVPPLNLVSDGEKIGSLCDGSILVVRGGETPKTMVKNSTNQIERAGCPLLGIVLNRVKGSGSGYYYKKYGGGSYYGKYGKEGYYYK